MPTVTFLDSKRTKRKQSNSGLKRLIRYVLNEKKTTGEINGGILCAPESAYEDFLLTQQAFKKSEGRLFVHFELSFSEKDQITPSQVKEMAEELLKHKAFKGFQVLYAVHTDTDNLHCHFVLNTVNTENGKKWQNPPKLKFELIEKANEIGQSYGCKIPEKVKKKEYSRISRSSYRAEVENRSWKKEMKLFISEIVRNSASREEFIKNANQAGYKLRFREKDILFTNPQGYHWSSEKMGDKFSKAYIAKMLHLNHKYAEERTLTENIRSLLKKVGRKNPLLNIPEEFVPPEEKRIIIEKEYQFLEQQYKKYKLNLREEYFELFLITQAALNYSNSMEEMLHRIQSMGLDCCLKNGELVFSMDDFDLPMDVAGLDRKTIELLMKKKDLRELETKEIQKEEKRLSWRTDIYWKVKTAKGRSISREDFMENLKEQGISVRWEENRKYITFENEAGNRIRNNKLYPKELFTKESLEKSFEEHRKWQEERTEEYRKYFREILCLAYSSTSWENFSKKLQEHGFREDETHIWHQDQKYDKQNLDANFHLEEIFQRNRSCAKMDFVSHLLSLLWTHQEQHQEKYPLSKSLEGEALREYIAEMKKGTGIDFGGPSWER